MVHEFLRKHASKIIAILVIALLISVYKSIFLLPITTAGDLPFYWDAYVKQFGIPSIWNPHWPTGLGGNQAIVLPLKFYFHVPIVFFVQQLHMPWEFIERIVFFFAFFFLSIYTSYSLTKSWIGSLIFAGNTWIIMVFSGGQMGIALAYSIAPLVLKYFMTIIEHIDNASVKKAKNVFHYLLEQPKLIAVSISAGILLSIQMMFDVRMSYISLIALFILFIFFVLTHASKDKRESQFLFIITFIIVPGIISLLLNIYWLLPLLYSGTSLQTVSIQPTLEQVKFFSFATISNTIGFLQPNWPENIFGKVSFMKPEFLLLPIVAFSSLLFLPHRSKTDKKDLKEKQTVLFFAVLGLLGIFLAKGANEPLGNIYLWMFENMPGFNMFRDSTKFYMLISLSYAYLIPYTLYKTATLLTNIFKKRKLPMLIKNHMLQILPVIFILYFAWLLLPALQGNINGIFKQNTIPQEYVELTGFLENENQFARTLWIPQQQRFGFYDNDIPALSGLDVFPGVHPKNIARELQKPNAKSILQEMSVKYVILPEDSNGEIFVTDRKYDEKLYRQAYKDLKKIRWLKEIKQFDKVIVFEVSEPKDHFWIITKSDKNTQLKSYIRKSDTDYEVILNNSQKGDRLVFSEQYDKGWILTSEDNTIESMPYRNRLNSYILEQDMQKVNLSYQPQNVLNLGWGISGLFLFVALAFLLKIRRKTR